VTADHDPRLSRPASKAGRLQRGLLELLAEHEDDDAIPTSGRFLWYELVQRGVVDPKKARGHPGVMRGIDQDVNVALTHLREHGIIPWSWIEDETRQVSVYRGAASVLAGVRAQVADQRLDPWGDPANRPLILTESRSLAGVLQGVADAYCCDLTSSNGQVAGFLHTEVAPRLHDGQPLLYVGDLNLSGGHIEDNNRRVLEGYAGLAWERLALTRAQARADDLEHLAVEKLDPRYKPARREESIEAEALGQSVIVEIVRDHLDGLLPEPLAAVQVRERAQRAAVVAALARLDGDGGRR
jgi:hypothetical protein